MMTESCFKISGWCYIAEVGRLCLWDHTALHSLWKLRRAGGNTDQTLAISTAAPEATEALDPHPCFPVDTIPLDNTRAVNSFDTPWKFYYHKKGKRIRAIRRPMKTKLLPLRQKTTIPVLPQPLPKLHATVSFLKCKFSQVCLGVGMGVGTVAQGLKALERKWQAHLERERQAHKGRRAAGRHGITEGKRIRGFG